MLCRSFNLFQPNHACRSALLGATEGAATCLAVPRELTKSTDPDPHLVKKTWENNDLTWPRQVPSIQWNCFTADKSTQISHRSMNLAVGPATQIQFGFQKLNGRHRHPPNQRLKPHNACASSQPSGESPNLQPLGRWLGVHRFFAWCQLYRLCLLINLLPHCLHQVIFDYEVSVGDSSQNNLSAGTPCNIIHQGHERFQGLAPWGARRAHSLRQEEEVAPHLGGNHWLVVAGWRNVPNILMQKVIFQKSGQKW